MRPAPANRIATTAIDFLVGNSLDFSASFAALSFAYQAVETFEKRDGVHESAVSHAGAVPSTGQDWTRPAAPFRVIERWVPSIPDHYALSMRAAGEHSQ